jgi:hypothetical protein
LEKLCEFVGDKIACVRVAVGEVIKNIMIKRHVAIKDMMGYFNKNLGSKNWFERQSVYRIVLELIKVSGNHAREKEAI